jgi:hypothetical protein
MDPTTREVLALVGGYDYHAGDSIAPARARSRDRRSSHFYGAGRRGHRITARDDPERRARGLPAVEAAEYDEGRVPRSVCACVTALARQ